MNDNKGNTYNRDSNTGNSYVKKEGTLPYSPNKKDGKSGFMNQLKMRIDKVFEEVSGLKERIYHLEQYFVAEKADYVWEKVSIVFTDGSDERFTKVKVKKYTYEALDIYKHVVHIQKNAVRYVREIAEIDE